MQRAHAECQTRKPSGVELINRWNLWLQNFAKLRTLGKHDGHRRHGIAHDIGSVFNPGRAITSLGPVPGIVRNTRVQFRISHVYVALLRRASCVIKLCTWWTALGYVTCGVLIKLIEYDRAYTIAGLLEIVKWCAPTNWLHIQAN